ncbi:MAG: DUF262 domain-containing protein [Bacteroidia bacterium]|jgi:uncharacterized protein with ParB-like and HNH nuclease domain|nr:DUF262 domain-containing protein [Bacteroidia bacterium]
MEASTTVNKMLAGNRIFVPTYQRAYSWDTEFDKSKTPKQVNVFLSDLEDYNKSLATTSYYFGHFLFEEKSESNFGVIDGQQRLTTILIFLSALFSKLKSIRTLTENEEVLFENMIKRKSNYIFSTVDYDNQLFKDYVVDQTKKNRNGLETESARRIVNAFDFFTKALSDKDEVYLLKMLKTVNEASCSTHPVKNESEAIQMFIFQNNRGKKPSNLEIIKAQFMFNVHLYGGDEKDSLIDEIKNRFEKIYKSISSIEYKIDEDDVLVYTLRVHFNSLWESNAIDKINKLLSDNNPIPFIKSFTNSLAVSFEHLTTFFGKDERENIEIHSLITLGGFATAIPFVIKAYSFGLQTKEICKICSSMEAMVLRHRLIGTRAELTSRINDVYQSFTLEHPDIKPIVDRIEWMKNVSNDSWWWAYWNKNELEKSIQGGMHHSTAKFLLWKYENYLENQGKSGYSVTRFDKIESPELEHIAPQTPTNGEPIAAGYCEYDEEFRNQYIDCLGNYLLLSKSHNCSVGNKPFIEKRSSYNHLGQQREIQNMTSESEIWDKEKISLRKDKIVKFILENF